MTMNSAERAERWLSIGVGLAAICAVAVSLYQAQLARAQLRASAWPYVAQGNGYTTGNPYIRVVSNEGIGPARVKSFSVMVDEKPVKSWADAMRAMIGEVHGSLVYSSLGRGSVLPPGSQRTVLTIPPGPLAQNFWVQAQTRLHTVVCYCSVYDECWRADSNVEEPAPVDGCTEDLAKEFRQ